MHEIYTFARSFLIILADHDDVDDGDCGVEDVDGKG